MVIQLVPATTNLKLNTEEPSSYQLHDCFECYLPRPIEMRLNELNTTYPIAGLFSQIEAGQITKGQWLLYTATSFSGQISNGGAEQFFGNCPGLINDVDKLLRTYGSADFAIAYETAAKPFNVVIRDFAAIDPDVTGDALKSFWEAIETAWDNVDESAFSAIENVAYPIDQDTPANKWFNSMQTKIVEWVLSHPSEFRAAN